MKTKDYLILGLIFLVFEIIAAIAYLITDIHKEYALTYVLGSGAIATTFLILWINDELKK